MRLSSPRTTASGWLLTAGVALMALLLSALPALGATGATTTAKPVDPETLPIPEGSSSPTALSGGGGGTLLRLGLGLIVVVGLIALVWYVMKRIQRSRFPALEDRGTSLIDVVATTTLGPSRNLHLVRVGEEIVLIGATDSSVNAIARIGAEDAALLAGIAGVTDLPPAEPNFSRTGGSATRSSGLDDRARAVATATDGSLVERLRAMTTRQR